MRSTPAEIDDAVRRFQSGEFQSLRACAKETGVPRTTIQNRLQGTLPAYKAHQNEQLMLQEMEERLVEWVRLEYRAGQGPNYKRFHAMARDLLVQAGKPPEIGRNWHLAFLERHPTIKPLVARKVEASRINSGTTETIVKWFERLDDTVHRFKIRPQHI